MIGPCTKKMPNKQVCTDCDVLISKAIGGTQRFPKKRVVNYCSHPDLKTEVSFIKEFPYTPKWCPVLAAKYNPRINIDWSEFTWSENTCHCRCGEIFRSHAKYVMAAKRMITRKKCPRCKKNNDCWRVTSDPEAIEI